MAENSSLPPTTNKYFLRALVDISAQHSVEVYDDVFNQSGAKLVSSGSMVNAELYERIANQKLRRPFESCLRVANPITGAELAQQAEALIAQNDALKNFASWSQGELNPIKILSEIEFNVPTAALLKVFTQRSETILSHGITVALIAMGVASALGNKDPRLLKGLANAGLLHDLGEMYIDPELMSRGRQLTPREWLSHAYHPIVSAALLKEVSGFDPLAVRAVVEHHERLDGFGYPRGLKGDGFSFGGRMLALGETLSALVSKGINTERRINIALKIMAGEYESELVAIVHELLQAGKEGEKPIHALEDDPEILQQSIYTTFMQIANVLTVYDAISSNSSHLSPASHRIIQETMDRFARVQRAFASTGVGNMADFETMLEPHEIAELRFEAKCVLDEIKWRLLKLSRELALKTSGLTPMETRTFMRLADALAGGDGAEQEDAPPKKDADLVLF